MAPRDSHTGAELSGAEAEPVVVDAFPDLVAAELALGRLQAEGIPARLRNEETVAVAWHLGNAVGGIELAVRRADAERAREVLGDVRGRGAHAARAAAQSGEAATRVSDEDLARRALLAALLGLLLPPVQLVSLWLLVELLRRPGRRTTPVRRRMLLALLLDLWLPIFVLVFLA